MPPRKNTKTKALAFSTALVWKIMTAYFEQKRPNRSNKNKYIKEKYSVQAGGLRKATVMEDISEEAKTMIREQFNQTPRDTSNRELIPTIVNGLIEQGATFYNSVTNIFNDN